jgi:hypothetical protein
VPLTLAIFLMLATVPQQDEKLSPVGNEPGPLVLILGQSEVIRRFQPFDPATFGEDGRRRLDYDFAKAEGAGGDGLARRKVDADEPDGPAIPLGLGLALNDGRPCVVLEMDRPQGKAAISKGVDFSLKLRAVEPNKLREKFGPGVYEGQAWLRFFQGGARDVLPGERKHLLRLRLVIPGRRVARLSVTGTPAVGRRFSVIATVEESLARPEDESSPTGDSRGDRLRVEIVPQGESTATLELPWPVPAGIWDPRETGSKGERAGWAIPPAWLDEPMLIGDPGSRTVLPVDDGPALSVIHRQTLRLPPLFAPGTLTAKLTPVGSASKVTEEIPIGSGLLAGPSLAFLKESISLQAKLAVSQDRSVNPPESIKVMVTDPEGHSEFYELTGERRATGYVWYNKLKNSKDKGRLRASLPGYYKCVPATGNAALDQALGGEVVILAVLEKEATALRRERVAFLGTTPIHWPLIVWLDSGRKDGSMHRAETRGAIALKSVRGPEEIGELSLTLSQIAVPARQRPHDDDKDGKIQFSGSEKTPRTRWPFNRKGISLDLVADIDAATSKKTLPAKGLRERSARFIVAGLGPDKEMIGRIFREPCSYKIAAHWDYYQEWAWLPGLILAAVGFWLYIKHVNAGNKNRSKNRSKATTKGSSTTPTTGQSRFCKAWAEPEKKSEPTTSSEPPSRTPPKDPNSPPGDGKRRFRSEKR